GDDRTFDRKFREVAIAVTVSQRFSRHQILEMYLNTISYGNGAYGAEAAARIYFHTDAADLDLAQAALLAGLPQSPSRLDPRGSWRCWTRCPARGRRARRRRHLRTPRTPRHHSTCSRRSR